MWFGIGFVKNQFGCDFHTFQLQLCASSGAGKCQTVSSKWIVPGKCVKREVVFFFVLSSSLSPCSAMTALAVKFLYISYSFFYCLQQFHPFYYASHYVISSTFFSLHLPLLCFLSIIRVPVCYQVFHFSLLSLCGCKKFLVFFSNFIDKRSSCLCILSDSFVGFLFCPFDSVWASFSRPWFLSSFVFILKLPKPHMRTSGWGVGSIQEFSVLLWMDMCFFYRFF